MLVQMKAGAMRSGFFGRACAVESREFMVSSLLHSPSRIVGRPSLGFSARGESGAAIVGAGFDAFQLEGVENWTGHEVRQGQGDIFPGAIKISRRERPSRHQIQDERRRNAVTRKKSDICGFISLFAHLHVAAHKLKKRQIRAIDTNDKSEARPLRRICKSIGPCSP